MPGGRREESPVNRRFLTCLAAALAIASPARAGTFSRTPIAPGMGIDALTRGVARQMAGRDVFAAPYGTVTISHVDVYDRFPYVESRHFQLVTDVAWNRIVFGEPGQSLAAFDGSGTSIGPLSGPRGMAVDEHDRVYVADTGHDRIVVLQAHTEYDQVALTPLYAIAGLHAPYDVAYSDGGTPFVDGDDALLVADTGRNRVVAYALDARGARAVAALGGLGSGEGQFAGPLAVAVGRAGGANTPDVYVADAQNARIVKLRLERGALEWNGSAPAGASVVTSLDTDHWGNVYAAAPRQGLVRKLNAGLEPLAELGGALAQPRAFRVPFATVTDHRDGSVRRAGQPNALSLDQWADDSGLLLWNLGLAVDRLSVEGGAAPAARFRITDPATVTLQVVDPATGRVLASQAGGVLGAGTHTLALAPATIEAAGGGAHAVRVAAVSRYAGGPTASAQAGFSAAGAPAAAPGAPLLLGNSPNPVRDATTLAFELPSAAAAGATVALYDAQGRRVRSLAGPFAAGLNSVRWDGADDAGRPVRAGLYFVRLTAGGYELSRRVAVVR